jgi:hypothetical protein
MTPEEVEELRRRAAAEPHRWLTPEDVAEQQRLLREDLAEARAAWKAREAEEARKAREKASGSS